MMDEEREEEDEVGAARDDVRKVKKKEDACNERGGQIKELGLESKVA